MGKMVLSYGGILGLAAALLATESLCRSSGPPVSKPEYRDQVCNRMLPYHARLDPQPGNGGYLIETDLQLSSDPARKEFYFSAGQIYRVKILATASTFRGFLMVAHLPGHYSTHLGQFIPQNINQQTLPCDELGVNNQSAIGHFNPASIDFHSVELMWQAPQQNDGVVDFRYTVVRDFKTFHVQLSAANNMLPRAINHTSPQLRIPIEDPAKYRLTFHDPPHCKPSECDVFVGVDNNLGDSNFLNIYLEGKAGGWVAVGFSKTHSMFAADVVACNKPMNGSADDLEAIDAWNSAVERRATVDPNSDVVEFSKNYIDGRLSCSVAKRIEATDPSHDLHLDSLLYVMYGRRRGDSGRMELFPHETGPEDIPKITNELLNPVTLRASIDDQFPRPILLQVHGMIMIIAWSLLATTGILFAACMKPTLPNGEWFQVHRAFLLASMFLGAVGFVLPFAANYNRNPRGLVELGCGNIFGTSHFAIGLAVMLLHIVNPIVAACRCKPDTKRRWAFKIFHGIFIGKLVFILALANICLGAYTMFKKTTTLLWVCIAYSALMIVLIMLSVMFKCSCRSKFRKELVSHVAMNNQHQLLIFSDDEDEEENTVEEEELTAFDGSLKDTIITETSRVKRRPVMSKDSTLRWIFLVIYLIFSILFTVAMVVLIALQV